MCSVAMMARSCSHKESELQCEQGSYSSKNELTWNSGHATINYARSQFVVDNVSNGFDLHQLDNGSFVRNYPTERPKKRFPRRVAFGEDGKVIVDESDHGVVHVFDRRTGSQLDILHHANAT
jgi:hypothetical protein